MANDPKLLTRAEAAAYLSVHPQTLALWASNRVNLPFIKVGKAVRYREGDLEEFLRRHTVKPGEGGACETRVGADA